LTTPFSLAPISAPHIQKGRESNTAWVSAAWGISIQVQRTVASGPWVRRGCHSSSWASLGSRSEFLAKSTRPGATTTIVSHMGRRLRDAAGAVAGVPGWGQPPRRDDDGGQERGNRVGTGAGARRRLRGRRRRRLVVHDLDDFAA